MKTTLRTLKSQIALRTITPIIIGTLEVDSVPAKDPGSRRNPVADLTKSMMKTSSEELGIFSL